MQTTVNVVCYKSKTLANGEHPLMIRLCQGRKLKYLSLGISILPQFGDFDKNKPRRNCPNKDTSSNTNFTAFRRHNVYSISYI